MNCSGNKGFMLIYGKYRKAFPAGNYESVPISAFPVVALHHAEVFPTVAFVERGVFRDEVERADAFRRHILADMCQEASGNATTAQFRLDIQGADIRRQVLAVVEIVRYHTGSNSFGEGEMLQAFIAETVFTFIFVLVVLGATDKKHGAGNLAGLAIGLTLILIHIVCIPITGTSVNPARSIAPAVFDGGTALSQLWLFIVSPFIGAALSALVWKGLSKEN